MVRKAHNYGLGRRAARTGLAVLSGNLLSFILGIALIVLVARLLGPSAFGAFTIAVSYYLLVDAAFQYGIGTYVNKHMAQYSAGAKPDAHMLKKVFYSGFTLGLLLAVITAAVGITASFLVAGAYAKTGLTATSFIIASCVIFFAILYGISYSGLIGLGRARAVAGVMSLQSVAELVAAVSLILLGFGVDGALAGIVIGYVFGFAAAFSELVISLKRIVGRLLPSVLDIRDVVHFIAPLSVINIMSSAVSNFSTLLLGIFVSAAVMGSFGVAMRGVTGLTAVYVSITAALVPVFSILANSTSGKSSKQHNELVAYSLVLIMPMFAFVASLSKPLVFLLVSSKYAWAPLYLSLIAIGVAISLLGKFLSSLMIAKSDNKKLMQFYAISTIAQLALLLALVPIFKVVGAIVAVFFFGSAIFTWLVVRHSGRALNLDLDSRQLYRVFGSSIILGILLLASYLAAVPIAELICGTVIAAVAYPALLGIMKALDKNDIATIKEAIKGMPMHKIFDLLLDYTGLFVGRFNGL
ncbi:MAG: oligosaccharide flippase family protein [Candidatus Micrarchaeia archaeon]